MLSKVKKLRSLSFLLVLTCGSIFAGPARGYWLGQDKHATDPYDPLNAIATGYQLTPEQKEALIGLNAALAAVFEYRKTDQAAVIRSDLFAIADQTSRAEKDSIAAISEMVEYAMAHVTLTNSSIKQITRDLWLIVNMSSVKSNSLSATADLCDRFEEGGLERGPLTKLRAAIDTIITAHGR